MTYRAVAANVTRTSPEPLHCKLTRFYVASDCSVIGLSVAGLHIAMRNSIPYGVAKNNSGRRNAADVVRSSDVMIT